MAQIPRIPTLIPLVVSAIVFASTVLIHAAPLWATINLVLREKKLGREGVGFWNDFAIVAMVITYALVAHLTEIAIWAIVFIICGEFHEFGIAYYHSAVNYTTIGYGDIVMSTSWRLLGPMEAADGMLMFGLSTAMIFAVIQWLIQARFVELRN
jgi:hypothetical protein